MAGRILSCLCGRHTILNIDHSSLSSIYITSTTNLQTCAANPPSTSSISKLPSSTNQPRSFTRRPPSYRSIPLWSRLAITSPHSHASSFSSFSTSLPNLPTILRLNLVQPISSKPILPFISPTLSPATTTSSLATTVSFPTSPSLLLLFFAIFPSFRSPSQYIPFPFSCSSPSVFPGSPALAPPLK